MEQYLIQRKIFLMERKKCRDVQLMMLYNMNIELIDLKHKRLLIEDPQIAIVFKRCSDFYRHRFKEIISNIRCEIRNANREFSHLYPSLDDINVKIN